MDIPPNNGKFTWSNKRAGIHNIKERLDRILIHERIVSGFSSVKSKIVHATASDHKLVVLTLDNGRNLEPLPFKNNKAWDSKGDFRKLIKDHWEMEVIGSPHYIWEIKLKSLRAATKQWAKENAVTKNKKEQSYTGKWNSGIKRKRIVKSQRMINPRKMKCLGNSTSKIERRKKNKDRN